MLDTAASPTAECVSHSHSIASTGCGPARPIVFTVPGLDGYLQPHDDFRNGLHREQKFALFELPGLRTRERPLTRVEAIAHRYCQALARVQPHGHIHLAAFCTGALIGLAMEQRLRQAGRQVRKLVLVDPLLPPGLVALHSAGQWQDALAAKRLCDEARRSDLELRFRAALLRFRQRGRDPLLIQYPGRRFSVDARAKLMAAFLCHLPEPVSMTVDVVASRERNTGAQAPVRTPSAWDHFLPRRRVYVAGDTHAELLRSRGRATAALIQRILDKPVGQPA